MPSFSLGRFFSRWPYSTSLPSHSSAYRILKRSLDLLAKELRKLDYYVGFYPILILGSLSSPKDRVAPSKKPGVYRLNCPDCSARYIGQTGCTLKRRLAQHTTHYKQLRNGKQRHLRDGSPLFRSSTHIWYFRGRTPSLLWELFKAEQTWRMRNASWIKNLSGRLLLNNLNASSLGNRSPI